MPAKTYFMEAKRLSNTVGLKLLSSAWVNPSAWMIFICLTKVLLPLSPAPEIARKSRCIGGSESLRCWLTEKQDFDDIALLLGELSELSVDFFRALPSLTFFTF